MKIVLSTVGSRGDVQPMLVLGEELLRRGHRVTIAAPPNFRASVVADGLPFWPIGADSAQIIEENTALTERNPVAALPRILGILKREVRRQIADLLEFPEDADVVTGAGLSFGARMLAEQRSARFAYVSYSLAGLRSSKHPPAALPIFGLRGLGNRALWAGMVGLFEAALGSLIAAERTARGLPRVRAWQSVHGPPLLLAQDELMGSVPADAVGCSGRVPALVRLGTPAPLPSDVERFLAGRDPQQPLVYLGFGSMPSVDRARLEASAIEAAQKTSARMLVLSPETQPLPPETGVIRVRELDHRALFPRLDLIVHHGGAGTTATALRAGVPQLIVPHVLDQFFHGRRIHELGIGPRPFKKSALDAARLIAAIEAHAGYRERARAAGTELAGTSGAAGAADFLEALRSP